MEAPQIRGEWAWRPGPATESEKGVKKSLKGRGMSKGGGGIEKERSC